MENGIGAYCVEEHAQNIWSGYMRATFSMFDKNFVPFLRQI